MGKNVERSDDEIDRIIDEISAREKVDKFVRPGALPIEDRAGAPDLRITVTDPSELIPTERAALLTFILVRNAGRKFTTAQLAGMTGLSNHGAWNMLRKLCRILPIHNDPNRGIWFILKKKVEKR